MAVSKVILNGTTLIDTTDKTVTAGSMLNGVTALKNDGTTATGSIASKSSTNLTVNGATVTAPAGYYSAAASKSVASGTAGTPTASKGTVSNHSVSVTPSVTNTTGYISGGTKSGTAVTVSASELVSGTKSITENGTGIDVTNYAAVDVAVSGGSSVTVEPLSVTQNGTYTAPSGTAYSPVTVNVSGGGGLVYEEGTFVPTEDVSHPSIPFAGTHTTRPVYVVIVDSDYETQGTIATESVLAWRITSFLDAFGHGIYQSPSYTNLATAQYHYSGERGTGNASYYVRTLTGSDYFAMNYSLTESGFSPYMGGTSIRFRAGRTYKWLAVWGLGS